MRATAMRTIAVVTALIATAAGAPARQSNAPATTIIERMGEPMTEAQARHEIGFAPFAPPRRVIASALLPPFHGDDRKANRGIGLEYIDAAGHRYALAQWPANGGTLDRFLPYDDADAECSDARMFSRGTKPNGIVWSTPHGRILSLQADGANDARTLNKEWLKLIRRGACR